MTRGEVMARLRDWLHEREIRRLGNACVEAMEAHDTAKAVHFWVAHGEAIKARSPAQIERMEVRLGLRARTTIKRNVMQAFGRGWLPASAVTFVFRVFRLRGL